MIKYFWFKWENQTTIFFKELNHDYKVVKRTILKYSNNFTMHIKKS